MDQADIKQNISLRVDAEEVFDLACSQCQEYDTESQARFWSVLFEKFGCVPKDNVRVVRATPMTNEEAARFESQTMLFGKHAGMLIRDVPLDYLSWLGEEGFHRDLHRYLENEQVRRLCDGIAERENSCG